MHFPSCKTPTFFLIPSSLSEPAAGNGGPLRRGPVAGPRQPGERDEQPERVHDAERHHTQPAAAAQQPRRGRRRRGGAVLPAEPTRGVGGLDPR